MAYFDFPEVRAGDAVTETLWNRARAAVRANRLIQGVGILLRWTKDGTVISSTTPAQPWISPFLCLLQGAKQASINTGLVNGKEPLIKGVYLSGKAQDGTNIPSLSFSPQFAPDGTGYLALQLTCDKNWILIPETLTVVQVAYYDSPDGKTIPAGEGGAATIGGIPGLPGRMVRYPLAMMRQRSSGSVDLIQNVLSNLTHRADPRGDDLARHFFSPA